VRDAARDAAREAVTMVTARLHRFPEQHHKSAAKASLRPYGKHRAGGHYNLGDTTRCSVKSKGVILTVNVYTVRPSFAISIGGTHMLTTTIG
jgi:hypothetical protein